MAAGNPRAGPGDETMQKLDRNGKQQRRQLRDAQLEAEQFISEMMRRRGRSGMRIGQMISAAAAGGLLSATRNEKKIRA